MTKLFSRFLWSVLLLCAQVVHAGTIVVQLEEPQPDGTYNGVGNLRGYAVSSSGIARVDLYVDNEFVQSLPYGGLRNDVANVYPSYPNASRSGFSMAYNYSNLAAGSHTISVTAVDNDGATKPSSGTFQVTKFHTNWIANAADVTLGSASVALQGETLSLNNVLVQNTPYNIQMQWNNPVQGWRITSIAREGAVDGTISGQVIDAVTKSPLAAATVNVYKGDGVLQAVATTNASGQFSVSVPALVSAAAVEEGYSAVITKSNYMSTTYKSIEVVENATTFLETVRQIGNAYQGTGKAVGLLTNALTGAPITNAYLYFREGINERNGAIIATALTGASESLHTLAAAGEYEVSLEAGNYTAEVQADGFNNTYFTVYGLGNQIVADQNAAATPSLSQGQTRIVLTWGTTVADLDSHLTGPTGQGSERFHVYYGNEVVENADLDLDDTSYQGPETITIREQLSGVYRYSVHDYTNKDMTSSTALSGSGAHVDVYRDNGLVASFNVPNNQGGTLWTVFELNGSTLTPINSMSYESTPYNVQGMGAVFPPSDAHLLHDMPEK